MIVKEWTVHQMLVKYSTTKLKQRTTENTKSNQTTTQHISAFINEPSIRKEKTKWQVK